MPRQTSTIGVSWNASVPMTLVGTWPVIAMSGMLSSLASAMAVTRLVAPGPLVAMQTPTLPVLRATPWVGKPGEGLVERHATAARIGEDRVHAVVYQGLDEDIGSAG